MVFSIFEDTFSLLPKDINWIAESYTVLQNICSWNHNCISEPSVRDMEWRTGLGSGAPRVHGMAAVVLTVAVAALASAAI